LSLELRTFRDRIILFRPKVSSKTGDIPIIAGNFSPDKTCGDFVQTSPQVLQSVKYPDRKIPPAPGKIFSLTPDFLCFSFS
jgi:hypothetical protein